MLLFYQVTDDAVVKVLHCNPLDTFPSVLLLLLFEYEFNEELLEFLVAVVDAELFKTVWYQ